MFAFNAVPEHALHSPDDIRALYESFMELAEDARGFLAKIVEQSREYDEEFNVTYESLEEDEKYPLMEAVGEIIDVQRTFEGWEEGRIDGEELVVVIRRKKTELDKLLVFMTPRNRWSDEWRDHIPDHTANPGSAISRDLTISSNPTLKSIYKHILAANASPVHTIAQNTQLTSMPYHNYGTMSTTPATPPLTILLKHNPSTSTPQANSNDLLTPPDSPTSHPLTQHQTALLTLMRRYLALHLRADQARTRMHRQLQQNRYVDVFHGPSYECVRDWQGRLERAGREYVEAEKWGRRVLAGEERLVEGEAEGGEKLVEGVRRRVDDLEELLREIG